MGIRVNTPSSDNTEGIRVRFPRHRVSQFRSEFQERHQNERPFRHSRVRYREILRFQLETAVEQKVEIYGPRPHPDLTAPVPAQIRLYFLEPMQKRERRQKRFALSHGIEEIRLVPQVKWGGLVNT